MDIATNCRFPVMPSIKLCSNGTLSCLCNFLSIGGTYPLPDCRPHFVSVRRNLQPFVVNYQRGKCNTDDRGGDGGIDVPRVSHRNKSKTRLGDGCGADNGSASSICLYPPSGKSVVVVESVTKAKVIQKYLGDMFEVLPSYGHIRELARRPGSVRPEEDFVMIWEVPSAAWTHLRSIVAALNGAKNLILASAPDCEGEAIAWHMTEMLQQQDAFDRGINVARIIFHEITEQAIKNALRSPRKINMDLVNSYNARCALDYLIGFNVSPLLWRKLPGCRSAGLVQSAALTIICDREAEIEQFRSQEYWAVAINLKSRDVDSFQRAAITSQLTQYNSKKITQFSICTLEEAKDIKKYITGCNFEVIAVKSSIVCEDPPMLYTTSSLLHDAANILHFSATYTMEVAQRLYEGIEIRDDETMGLITYFRTDGLHVTDEAVDEIRAVIKERYGKEYATKATCKYSKTDKDALEAQEAIRPTNIRRLPSTLAGIIEGDSLKLYTLIWARTIASLMESAKVNMVQVEIGCSEGTTLFHSVASRLDFPGYKATYEDIEAKDFCRGNENSSSGGKYDILCKLKVNDMLSLENVNLEQFYTKPPPRYSEGSLIEKLKELGIGRPSIYAYAVKALQDRNYVVVKDLLLLTEFRGCMVSAFLSHYFPEVLDRNFAAKMEAQLNNVATGSADWKSLLTEFWERLRKCCDIASSCDIRQVEAMLEQRFGDNLFSALPNNSRVCPSCSKGILRFKLGKDGNGYVIACDQYPRCKYTASMLYSDDDQIADDKIPSDSIPPKLLGILPVSNEKVFLKNGPFGYYVQLGEDKKGISLKRAPISKDVADVDLVTLEDAMELLQYPLTLGKHPDDNWPVLVTRSKHGYTIKHKRTVSPVPKNVDPKKITLEVALKYLRSKKAKHFGRHKASSTTKESSDC